VHAEQPPVAVSNAGKTCCVVSAAPSPEAQSWGGGFAFVPPPVLASGMIAAKTFPENAWSPDIARDSSPPPLLSVLCTFLI